MNGQTVKGINFVNLMAAGDPVELGEKYSNSGADELVYLDITATIEERPVFAGLVKKVAEKINIPFTVGGGIRTETDVDILLDSGADKITLNSAAVRDPGLITKLSKRYGSQCIVVAIDSRCINGIDLVHVNGGRDRTPKRTKEWALEAESRGAGEIMLTSMDRDGTREGFDIRITSLVSLEVNIPVIASGGGGKKRDFLDVFKTGRADAALAAGIFHFGTESINGVKDYLHQSGITVRREYGHKKNRF